MLQLIKNFFRKEKILDRKGYDRRKPPRVGRRFEDSTNLIESINECIAQNLNKNACKTKCMYAFYCHHIEGNEFVIDKQGERYNSNKKTVLIIDDSPGLVSFLLDDLKDIINTEDYNILFFDGKYAVFKLIATSIQYKIFYDYAIIDLTYGGVVKATTGNIKLNGVDAFDFLYHSNKDLKFLFFTGNLLNTYIKTNEEMVEKFYKIFGDDIKNYLLQKNSSSLKDRQKQISERLFSV